ncbi:tetratricopeptide repeat protein [uncultured Porphyromonas sp.]|uniref:tetratricopeptide repeat protein n=1 Tax=uncultured Porphyromonas sp. TaxID=159274 RepID=UPI0025CF8602|nr:tetratricopeptide repeat protein [uncultured Porphyromonas sp.]
MRERIRLRLWMTALLVVCHLLPALAQIDPTRVMTIGQNAILFKDYVLAIQYFNTAIRVDSTSARPYYWRAVAKYSLGDVRGAEQDASVSIGRNPFIYDAFYLRALTRHTLGEDSLALQDYKVVLADNPDNRGALHNAAVLYTSMKDTISARRLLDHLHRYHPDYADGYLIDGGLRLQQGDTVAAQGLFEKALALSPSLTNAHLSMADIAYSRHKYREAEDYLDKAIRINANEPILYTNRALIRYQQNNMRGAMGDYTMAVELDPNNLIARYNRALLRTQVGELNGALDDFSRVVMLQPDNYFAIFNRALVANELGSYTLAKSDLTKIINRYPTFVPAFAERARANMGLGQTLEAKKDNYLASKMMYDPATRRKAEQQQKEMSELLKEDAENMYAEGGARQVRDERDDNIRKFRLLVYNSREKGYNELYVEAEEGGIRGRVQDREMPVEPMPLFTLSYYMKEEAQPRLGKERDYSGELHLPTSDRKIYVVNDLPVLNQLQFDYHMSRIDSFPQMREQDLFALAMDQVMVSDHAAAVATLDRVIAEHPDQPDAYLQRGVSRIKDFINRETVRHTQIDLGVDVSQADLSKDYLLKKATYTSSIEDFRKVLDLVPGYLPALYNLAYAHYGLGQYHEAISALSDLIIRDPSFGDAFFARGLAYYATGDKEKGDRDMSRAGALGVFGSYNIIKRMQ